MKKELKLYRVTLKGMTYSTTTVAAGISYVVAEDSEQAYQKVKQALDEKDYGFRSERELDKVELLASDVFYNDTGHVLYL